MFCGGAENMSKEDILKDYICAKYKSVRQFTMATGLKYSTVVAILSRGLGSASIENVIAICKALNISTDALIESGIILELPSSESNATTERIEAYLKIMKMYSAGGHYTIDGEPLTKWEQEQFMTGLEVLIELIRAQRKKRKPRKYTR